MTTTESAARIHAGAWRLNVLGPVELCYDGRPVDVTGLTRTLLALLARTPGEEVTTSSIVACIWGSAPPEDSEKEVASNISRLRRALTVVAPDVDPTSVVVTMPAGYILVVEPANADILAFERLAADGHRALAVGQPALALDRLEAALALWRGPAYADFDDHSFVTAEAARLEDLRLSVIESTVAARLAEAAPSAPEELLTELPAMLTDAWHRERLWILWMTALFRLGRRAEALAAFQQAESLLAQRLSVSPGADLRAAERAVIGSDRALYGQPVTAAAVPAALAITVPACVGREEELAWLSGALDLAATRRAQARLIVGAPGIGKTRTVAELAQRAAARGIPAYYWQVDATGLDAFLPEAGVVTLVVIEDLDQAGQDEIARVTAFIRATMSRPVVTLLTCRDPVRVGELANLPKLVLSALDDYAIADIVRVYAPTVPDGMAVAAMASSGGIPARIHRSASEWAFARAGRRIDRAVADAVSPTRRLATLSDEVVGGVLDLAHVRAQARPLRPVARDVVARPYKGLSSFDTGDADIFHGREHLVAELVARLVQRRLLAVVGDPGTGKSSLVRAGLLPALAAGVLPTSARWRPVIVRPAVGGSLAEQVAPHLDDLRRVELNFDDLYLDQTYQAQNDQQPPSTSRPSAYVPAQRTGQAPPGPAGVDTATLDAAESGSHRGDAAADQPQVGTYVVESRDDSRDDGARGDGASDDGAQHNAARRNGVGSDDASKDTDRDDADRDNDDGDNADRDNADRDNADRDNADLDGSGDGDGSHDVSNDDASHDDGSHDDASHNDASHDDANDDDVSHDDGGPDGAGNGDSGSGSGDGDGAAAYDRAQSPMEFAGEPAGERADSGTDERIQVAESYQDNADGPGAGDATVPSQDSILLVVDQFEEVFTALDPAARAEFLATVVELAETNRVILTLRGDFYGRCAENQDFAELVSANTVLIRPMTVEQTCRAIEGPAAAGGLTVQDGLSRQIVADARGLPGLTHLAVALYATWENRAGTELTLEAYRATGGVATAILNLAENAFASLTADERDAARRIMLCLTVVTGADVLAGRRASLAEVVASAGPFAPAALEKLVAGRLVTASEGAVEVTHDTVLEQWPRVREWLDEARAAEAQRRHLTESALAWAERDDPAALYRGARLAAALDLARFAGEDLSPGEHQFLAASQRVVLAADLRRRRRVVRLWRYLVAAIVVAVLAVAVAGVAVTLQLRSMAAQARTDGQRLASLAEAEPDLRKALLLAVAAGQLDSAATQTIRTVLLGSPDVVAATGHDVTSVALSPDGATVATATNGGTIWLYAADSLRQVGRLDLDGQGPVNGLAFTADGRRLVSWGGTRTDTGPNPTSIVVWDLASRKPVGTPFGQAWPGGGGGLLADGDTLLVAQHGADPARPPTPVAWSLEARTPSTAYDLPTTDVSAVQLSQDGHYVAFGTPAGSRVVDLATNTGQLIAGATKPLALSRDGRTLLAAGGSRLDVWDVATNRRTGQAISHTGEVLGAAWSPDASQFASVGADGLVIVWQADTLQPVKALAGHGGPVLVVRFGADGQMLYTVGEDGALFAWDLTGARGVGVRSDTESTALIALACTLAGRDLSQQEWQTYLPDRSYRHVCPS